MDGHSRLDCVPASPLFIVIITNLFLGKGTRQVVSALGHVTLKMGVTSARSPAVPSAYENGGLAILLSDGIESGDSSPGITV